MQNGIGEGWVINNVEPQDWRFTAPLVEAVTWLSGRSPSVMPYNEAGESKNIDRLRKADFIVVGGSPLHYANRTAERRQKYLEPWLHITEAKVAAICLGHQSIAVMFGESLNCSEEEEESSAGEEETGLCRLKLTVVGRQHEIFDDLPEEKLDNLEVLSKHQVSVAVPEGFLHLAESLPGPNSPNGCRNQIMVLERGDEKGSISSSQAHLEYTEAGRVILARMLGLNVPNDSPLIFESAEASEFMLD